MRSSDNAPAIARQPHAVLDLASRKLKAIKIERLLNLTALRRPMRMLEVGTGSGGIAHYFGTHAELHVDVDAVDVVDNRLVTDGYRFQLVTDTRLPYPDAAFDIVLTNHVIEHVGSRDEQLAHLREVRRVLREGGTGYLAVPNRWMLVEPHYRLAFLSWFPRRWRSRYLDWRRGVAFYDCEPLTMEQAEQLLGEAGFEFENLCVAALRSTLELEHRPSSPMRRIFDRIPDRLLVLTRRIIPTLIYKFWATGKCKEGPSGETVQMGRPA